MNPFFEQSWSMFSMPGYSSRFALFKYKLINKQTCETVETDWLDTKKPLLQSNTKHFFSISQRLLKYMSGCINNIFIIDNTAIESYHQFHTTYG